MIELTSMLCLVGLLAIVAHANRKAYWQDPLPLTGWSRQDYHEFLTDKPDVWTSPPFWKGPYRLGGCGDLLWVSRDEQWGLSRDGAWRLRHFATAEVYTYDHFNELMDDLRWLQKQGGYNDEPLSLRQ